MPIGPIEDRPFCSLLIFLATPDEEKGLAKAAKTYGLPFERVRRKDTILQEDYHFLGRVGNETVIAVRPVRDSGRLIMGSIGLLGTAARGMRLRIATGAQAIVQVGMAFGINPQSQAPGDVLVSTSIIPYDNRDIKPTPSDPARYETHYSQVIREPARPALVEMFRREKQRGDRDFQVNIGAILSGAARIHSQVYRDELVRLVPPGEDPIIGGEMEGVGLLAASMTPDDPVWCIVKGISDFADENRDSVIDEYRPVACLNAAKFMLDALINDAKE
jgi:adenosylhomocysteine nucleosidase